MPPAHSRSDRQRQSTDCQQHKTRWLWHDIQLNAIQRCAGRDEKCLTIGTAKVEIGRIFRKRQLEQLLPLSVPGPYGVLHRRIDVPRLDRSSARPARW